MPLHTSPVSAYLRARRNLVQPEDIGLPRTPNRRVSGLRREEVAQRAGISPDYYLRLEQGKDQQPSEQVLAALGRALLLDSDAVDYLRRIARPRPLLRRTPPAPPRVDSEVVRLLDQWSHSPAYMVDRNQDVVATNPLARLLSAGELAPGTNVVQSLFSAPGRAQFRNWEPTAQSAVAALRYHSEPLDPRLHEIVGGLAVKDADFRRMWARHDARARSCGSASNHIDGHGWVEFRWQSLEIPQSSGCVITVFFGDAGSPAADAIRYLSSQLRRPTEAMEMEPSLVTSTPKP